MFAAALLPLALYHRRRRGDGPGDRKDTSTIGESVYVLLLAAIVTVFVAKTFRTESRIDAVAPTGDVVQVTAFFAFVGLVFLAGSADRIAVQLHISYVLQVWLFRIAIFVVPPAVYFLAKWTCLELQERGRNRPDLV